MGEYLLCQYQMKKNTLQYVGEVTAISEESLPCVEFLENTKDPVLKKRKQIPERALVDHKNIIKKLHAPETVFRGRQVVLLFEELLKSC
ncbi:hypothetical protein SNE40_015312 [Patella caerulea]|uniref:Uncharacterized protein n=1 Tax=Patella caerulea TaxID=87958 RepID=A0AAN8JH24_PATCE